MSTEATFKIGPEYLNEALDAAEVQGVRMTKTPRGQLYLDTELSQAELVNVLLSGIALLYSKLFRLRQETGSKSD